MPEALGVVVSFKMTAAFSENSGFHKSHKGTWLQPSQGLATGHFLSQ